MAKSGSYRRTPLARRSSWTLLAGREASLRVNGTVALVLGIRALRDRDEISFAGQRCFFSTEELARIVPFPGWLNPFAARGANKRWSLAIPPSRARTAVRGITSRRNFPAGPTMPTCAFCQLQSTALDAGYSWTPEML